MLKEHRTHEAATALAAPAAFVVRDYDTLKVIADPLRAQILELLITEPLSVRQVAERLGLAPTKLYYHFGLLERIGLVVVAEARLVANMVEKTYRAAANSVELDPSLLNFRTDTGKESITTALTATLDTTRDDILRSLQARYAQLDQGAAEQPRRLVLTRLASRLSQKTADAFLERVTALLQEFDQADAGAEAGPDHLTYALTIAYYPSFYFGDAPDAPAGPQGNNDPSPGAAPDRPTRPTPGA
jgi:DNA-binding transcriptional ArsR family regulator